ncbi:hypothetical protein [Kineococcus sp. R86509]|uniref:hypothetical protein n=1 Tax=Kineococcus sp. R86509 TaxID=3093851 RepID=UPI0036D3C674
MDQAHLLDAHDHLVAMNYGQFELWTDYWSDDLDTEAVLQRALNGNHIAQEDHLLIITCPHQNNFEMPLRLERWDAAPQEDLQDWQEAYEAHVSVNEYGLYYQSPTLEGTQLPVPAGEYHALITGRGFISRGWPGSTAPGDAWRIRLWPSSGPDAPRQLLAWTS